MKSHNVANCNLHAAAVNHFVPSLYWAKLTAPENAIEKPQKHKPQFWNLKSIKLIFNAWSFLGSPGPMFVNVLRAKNFPRLVNIISDGNANEERLFSWNDAHFNYFARKQTTEDNLNVGWISHKFGIRSVDLNRFLEWTFNGIPCLRLRVQEETIAEL